MERSVRQRTRLLGLLLAILALPPAGFAQREGTTHAQKAFFPGEIWLDTRGKPINAHGGGMIYQGQTVRSGREHLLCVGPDEPVA